VREPTLEVRLDRLARRGHDVGFLLLATDVLGIELLRQFAGFVAHRLIRGQQQPSRDVGRAHSPRGVDARGQHEADVIAIDLFSDQPAHIKQ
jgi:hypothetical protein